MSKQTNWIEAEAKKAGIDIKAVDINASMEAGFLVTDADKIATADKIEAVRASNEAEEVRAIQADNGKQYFTITDGKQKIVTESVLFSKVSASVASAIKASRAIPIGYLARLTARDFAIMRVLHGMKDTNTLEFSKIRERVWNATKNALIKEAKSKVSGATANYYTMASIISEADIMRALFAMATIFGGYHLKINETTGSPVAQRHAGKVTLITASFYGTDEYVNSVGETEKHRFTLNVEPALVELFSAELTKEYGTASIITGLVQAQCKAILDGKKSGRSAKKAIGE